MDSLGDRLKESREKQNYTLEQIARDTRISRRYLRALEEEDFSMFPGETYLVGFLRNYTQYLGLDADEFVGLYRNMKIQEQPLPMDELIHGKPQRSSLPLLIGVAIGVVAIGVGGFFLFRTLSNRELLVTESGTEEIQPSSEEFLFDSESETRWFKEGDVIKVTLGAEQYSMTVDAIEENLSLAIPGGTVKLEVSESRFVDLNLDSKNDLKVVFNDIDRMAETKRVNLWMIKTASILLEEKSETTQAESESSETASQTEGETEEEEPAIEESEAPAETTTTAEGRVVVLEADSPRIFKVEVSFRGNCLFRYLLDSETRDQRFFQKGESFTVDNVKRELVCWISDAGVLQTKIENVPVRLGRSGQVVTKKIRWVRSDGSSRYQLEVVSTY